MQREKQKEKQEDLLKNYKNVFEEGAMNSLWYLITHRKFEGLESPVKLGKEANVFTALTKDDKRIVAKIYRIATSDFFKMSSYLEMDKRFRKVESKKQVVLTWAKREYSNLLKAYKSGVSVPMPIALRENILVMEFLGSKKPELPRPFPLMKDVVNDNNSEQVYSEFIKEVKKLYKAGLVHGDLSEFNVLVNPEDLKVYIIDLSHATPIISNAAADLLERDIFNVVKFFNRKGLKLNVEDVKEYIKGD